MRSIILKDVNSGELAETGLPEKPANPAEPHRRVRSQLPRVPAAGPAGQHPFLLPGGRGALPTALQQGSAGAEGRSGEAAVSGGNAGGARPAAVVVRFRKSKEELFHSRHACFTFWKERMAQKYGHVHEWFQSLCQERDIRRVALPRFLSHLERVLHDTQHSQCAKTVSIAFEKSRKNEIELSVFMNTILIDTRNSHRSSLTRTQRTKSALPTTSKKQRYQQTEPSKQELFKEEPTAACSSNKPGYQSLRQLGPMKSLTKYLTPHAHLKKYNSFLTG